MRVADVRLFWLRSPSPDIVKRRVVITVDGGDFLDVEVGPEVEEMTTTIEANRVCTYKTIVTDAEGNEVVSVEHTFRLGDLVAPLPDTDLGHEIVAVREVTDPQPTPEPEPTPEPAPEPDPESPV